MKDLLLRKGSVYFIFYFGLISLLQWRFDASLIYFWIGGVLGMSFSWVDRVLHVYLTRPFEQLSLQVKVLVEQKRYIDAMRLLEQRKHEQRHLTVRSALFLTAWVFMAFYVITSTGNNVGVGMVMAIGLVAVVDMLHDLSVLPQLKWWLFWQIKREISDTEARIFVLGYVLCFCILSLMVL